MEYARLDFIYLNTECSGIVEIMFIFFVMLCLNSVFILEAPCSAL